MSRWLVTGSEGFIGSFLCPYLSKENTVLGTYHKDQRKTDLFHGQAMNILDEKQVLSVMRDFNPGCVVHLAGSKDVTWCEKNREAAYSLNTQGLQNLAQACQQTSTFLIFLSSDYVFKGDAGGYAPTSTCCPLTVYGKTKLDAENLLAGMSMPHAIIRTAAVYAPVNPEKSLLGWAHQTLTQGKPIPAYQNVCNSPTLIEDLLKAIHLIGERRIPGIFHLAGASRESRYSFLRLFAKEFGFDEDLIKKDQYQFTGGFQRPLDISLDSKSSYERIGFAFSDADRGLKTAKRTCESLV